MRRNVRPKQTKLDGFITKSATSAVPKPSKPSGGRQTTIESLQGVVVMEELDRAKIVLTAKDQEPSVIVEALEKLGKKQPCQKILISTRLGKIVNRLRKHPESSVSAAADAVYSRWRGHIESVLSRPQVDVRGDASTEAVRGRGRDLLASSFGVDIEDESIARLERHIFFACERLLTGPYRRTIRHIARALRSGEAGTREKLLNRTFMDDGQTTDFVTKWKRM